MVEIVGFHHAQGLTDGVRHFADALTRAGHIVHLPDLYGGYTFAELFLYPGSEHLFTDDSLPAFDAESARNVADRVLTFLGGLS